MEEPEKGTVLYKKASGSLIIYDGKNKDGEYLAHVKESNGTEYDTMFLGSILARGYWDAVYIPESNDKV